MKNFEDTSIQSVSTITTTKFGNGWVAEFDDKTQELSLFNDENRLVLGMELSEMNKVANMIWTLNCQYRKK